jgi:type II secretory pathway pseudopilin PulG
LKNSAPSPPSRRLESSQRPAERGYILIILILFVALLAIGLMALAPVITQQIKRDREEELIHRGTQYSRAIKHYMKKFTKYPTRLEDLENTNNVRYLRKRYKDPITGKDFKLLHMGDVPMSAGAGLAGATSAATLAAGAGAAAAGNAFGGSGGFGGNSGGAFGGNSGSAFGGNSGGAFGGSSGGAFGGNSGSAFGGNSGSAFGGSSGGAFGGSSGGAFGGSSGGTFGGNPAQASNSNPDVGSDGANPAGQGGFGQPIQGLSGFNTQGTNGQQQANGNQAGANQAGGNQVFGGGPVVGVVSVSKDKSIRSFYKKDHYNDWQFIYDPTTDRGGLITTPNQSQMPAAATQSVNGTPAPNGTTGTSGTSGAPTSSFGFSGGQQNAPGGFGAPPQSPPAPPNQGPQ